MRGHELYGPYLWVILSVILLDNAHCLFTAVPLRGIGNEPNDLPTGPANRHFRIRVVQGSKIADLGQHADDLAGGSIALTEQTRVFSDQSILGPRVGMLDDIALRAVEAGLLFVIITEDLRAI